MLRLGYKRLDPTIQGGDLPGYYSRNKHAEYLHSADRTLVEIHAQLDENRIDFAFSPEVVASHRIEVDLFGCRIPTFDDEFLLAYLSFHASHHYVRRLFWLADVCVLERLIGSEGREAALKLVAACGSTKRLILCERLGESMADLSGNVRLTGSPRYVSRYVFGTWDRLHIEEADWSQSENLGRRLDRLFLDLYLIDGVMRRIRLLARTFFRPDNKELAIVRLPRILYGLYFPLRVARLSLRFMRKSTFAGFLTRKRRNPAMSANLF
jgi:hypothetical protein